MGQCIYFVYYHTPFLPPSFLVGRGGGLKASYYLFQTVFNLEKAGYKTVAVESQAEAESVIARLKPDLAIFDLMMESDDSGFILCYKIKRKYGLQSFKLKGNK